MLEDEAPVVKDRLPLEDSAHVLEEELAPNEMSSLPLLCTPSFGGYMKTWALSPIALGKIVICAIGGSVVDGGVSRFVGGGFSWLVGGGSMFVGGATLSMFAMICTMDPHVMLN